MALRRTFEFGFPRSGIPPRKPVTQRIIANKPGKLAWYGHPADFVTTLSGQANLTPPSLTGMTPMLVGGVAYLVSGTWALPGADVYRVLHDGDPVTDWLPQSQDIGGGQSLRNHLVEHNALGRTITAQMRRAGAAPVNLEGSRYIDPAITYQIVGSSVEFTDGSPFTPAMPLCVSPGDLALVFMVGTPATPTSGPGFPSRTGGQAGWQIPVDGITNGVDGSFLRTSWLYLPEGLTFGEWSNVGAWACLILRPSRKPAGWATQGLGWFGRVRHASRVDAAAMDWAQLPIMRAAFSRAICFYRRLADEPVTPHPYLLMLAEAGDEVRVGVGISPSEVIDWGSLTTEQTVAGGSDTLTVELRAYQTALYD